MQQSSQTRTTSNRLGVPIAFLLFFSFIWITVTTLATTLMIRGIVGQSDAATRFIPVPATITESSIKEHDGEDGTTYSNAVTYTYTHQGRNYTSDRIAFDGMSGSHRAAQRWARDNPPGASITAYIDPSSPSTAVLRTTTARSTWMMLVFLLPFQAVAIGCIAALGSVIRDWISPPELRHPLDGLLVREDGDRITFRLDTVSALSAGIATTGLTGFLSIFILLFTTGMNPPPVASISVAAVCIALGIWVGLFRLWRMHSGTLNLTIDRRGRFLLLPRSATSSDPAALDPLAPISFSSIRGIITRPTVSIATNNPAHNQNKSAPHPISLELQVGSAPHVQTITLHRTLTLDAAERIASFLRSECGLQPIDTPDSSALSQAA